jgi:hypothetical protein
MYNEVKQTQADQLDQLVEAVLEHIADHKLQEFQDRLFRLKFHNHYSINSMLLTIQKRLYKKSQLLIKGKHEHREVKSKHS